MAESHLFFGRNALKEALSCGVKISEIFYANDESKRFIEEIAPKGCPLRANVPSELRSISHQGVAFRAVYDFYLGAWDMKKNPFPYILLCNHLEDVQNLGSLARAAAAFGFGLIVHEERRSARMNAVGLKVSAGQAFRLKFLEVSNLTPFCRRLSDEDYQILGLDGGEEAANLYEFNYSSPLALVVGAEGTGLSRPVRAQMEALLRVPMHSKVESLNATHAASIAMSWIFRSSCDVKDFSAS